jgi:hypothetical protein
MKQFLMQLINCSVYFILNEKLCINTKNRIEFENQNTGTGCLIRSLMSNFFITSQIDNIYDCIKQF